MRSPSLDNYKQKINNSKKIDRMCDFRTADFPQIRIQFKEAAIFISMGDRSVPIFQEQIVCQELSFMIRFKVSIISLFTRGRRGRDRMVFGFITIYAISAYHH